MAGTFFRMVIIYLTIGMCLHLGGVQTTQNNVDPVGNFISYDPLNVQAYNNNATYLNENFSTSVNPDMQPKGSLFGFIDTLFAVVKFVSYLLTGMIFSPILLFTTYQLPAMFTYLFGSVMMIGLIFGFIYLIRSGLSP